MWSAAVPLARACTTARYDRRPCEGTCTIGPRPRSHPRPHRRHPRRRHPLRLAPPSHRPRASRLATRVCRVMGRTSADTAAVSPAPKSSSAVLRKAHQAAPDRRADGGYAGGLSSGRLRSSGGCLPGAISPRPGVRSSHPAGWPGTQAPARRAAAACQPGNKTASMPSVHKHVDHLCATAPSLCIRSGNAGDSAAWPQP